MHRVDKGEGEGHGAAREWARHEHEVAAREEHLCGDKGFRFRVQRALRVYI